MDKLLERFAAIAAQFAPDVVGAAKQAVVVEVYANLVSGVLCVLWCAAFVVVARWAERKCNAERYADEGWQILRFGCYAIAIVLFACGAWQFLDPWTWVALKHPELWIAKKHLL